MQRRHILFALITAAIVVASYLVVAEIVLRFLPVHTGFLTRAVNADDPVIRYDPDSNFTFSDEWNFAIVNYGRVNNAGFVNEQDYVVDDHRPLLAVIGDSFIEARMVPYADTLHGRLQQSVADAARVYSFGVSRSALAQYLVFAAHARDRYRPYAMVFNVVANDLVENLTSQQPNREGLHLYRNGEDNKLTLQRYDYEPSLMRSVLRESALARYLFFNLQISRIYFTIRMGSFNQENNMGNIAISFDVEDIVLSTAAIATFLDDLPHASGLDNKHILFVVDGIREMIYEPKLKRVAKESLFGQMRRRFIAMARDRGYEVIDLNPHFARHYERHGLRFEYPTDGHWNGVGHSVAANTVAGSKLFRTFRSEKRYKAMVP